MKIVGITGYSGAGKTTLLERLIPALRLQGQRASVIKHTHHDVDLDQPGKDSWRHRQAGALEVMLASSHRWALLRESQPPRQEPDWQALAARLDPGVDWVLVEGFRHGALPKLEVWRAGAGKPAHYPDDEAVVAIATDDASQLPRPPRPGTAVLDLNAPAAVAHWLASPAGGGARIPDWQA